jgi:hypothetical protein
VAVLRRHASRGRVLGRWLSGKETVRVAECPPYDQAEIDPELDPWRFLAERYGSVAGYLTERAEVSEETAERLRERLLTGTCDSRRAHVP